jgi:hypothetical protein
VSDSRDNLLHLLTMQERLQREAYATDIGQLTPEQRVNFIKDMVLAATDELHEALAETSWKPWASTFGEVNDDAFFAELVDLVHFVMNLLLTAVPGADPARVTAMLVAGYEVKNAKNLRRQVEGYDGKSNKCPACKRALDDEAVRCRRVTVDGFDGQHRFWCSHDAAFFHADGSRAPS